MRQISETCWEQGKDTHFFIDFEFGYNAGLMEEMWDPTHQFGLKINIHEYNKGKKHQQRNEMKIGALTKNKKGLWIKYIKKGTYKLEML